MQIINSRDNKFHASDSMSISCQLNDSDCSEKVVHFLCRYVRNNSGPLASGQVTRCANYTRDGCHLNWINSRIFYRTAGERQLMMNAASGDWLPVREGRATVLWIESRSSESLHFGNSRMSNGKVQSYT